MSNAVSKGVLHGVPFGGVGLLWHKSFNTQISFIKGDSEGSWLSFEAQCL